MEGYKNTDKPEQFERIDGGTFIKKGLSDREAMKIKNGNFTPEDVVNDEKGFLPPPSNDVDGNTRIFTNDVIPTMLENRHSTSEKVSQEAIKETMEAAIALAKKAEEDLPMLDEHVTYMRKQLINLKKQFDETLVRGQSLIEIVKEQKTSNDPQLGETLATFVRTKERARNLADAFENAADDVDEIANKSGLLHAMLGDRDEQDRPKFDIEKN
jgi:DNA-binding transcriptional MerR regulator